jgi:hypothetical protein
MMQKKVWWRSKTLWLNGLGLVALMVQTQTGFVISPEAQTAILGLVNLVLRLVTKEAVGLHDDQDPGETPVPPGPYPGLNGGTAADLKPQAGKPAPPSQG